ncbi:hypothetical protein C7I85_02910 [Mesorhizobium soli]|uniref:Uncharacterized protein n=1 Tax=Pseudaminobacter soli (ex Li et al. 2025) TaxID=1295366 RepID=A0A2P7SNS9_9HYPH|nr:hypothetical protein C7I85_02910 [Mesorhizobium soli]
MVHQYPFSMLPGQPRQVSKVAGPRPPARDCRSLFGATERFMFTRLFLVTALLLAALALVTKFPA